MRPFLTFALMLLALAVPAFAGENLKLNPKLDYTSDSEDGPLITGSSMDAGFDPGKPAYVIMYGEGCFNSKRQAWRRTCEICLTSCTKACLNMLDCPTLCAKGATK